MECQNTIKYNLYYKTFNQMICIYEDVVLCNYDIWIFDNWWVEVGFSYFSACRPLDT